MEANVVKAVVYLDDGSTEEFDWFICFGLSKKIKPELTVNGIKGMGMIESYGKIPSNPIITLSFLIPLSQAVTKILTDILSEFGGFGFNLSDIIEEFKKHLPSEN